MEYTYRYSSLLRSAEYRLTAEGVAITSRQYGRFARTLVPFDCIPMHSSTVTVTSKPLMWAAIVCAALFFVIVAVHFFDAHPEPGALLVYAGLFATFATAFFATRTTSELFVSEAGHLSIFRRRSGDPNLNSFIEELQRRKIDSLRQRISRRVGEVSEDELARYLLYLRDSNLVDDVGYIELRNYRDHLYSNQSRIGFHKGT
jgi:hypothetical protein